MKKSLFLLVLLVAMTIPLPRAGACDTAACLRELASGGDADAQYEIAMMYQRGEHYKEDHAKAFEWFMKSAIQGHSDAQLRVGMAYDNGDGVLMDNDEALSWYSKAYENGNNEAAFILGVYMLSDGEKMEEAVQHLTYAAENGFVLSQDLLGRMYRQGLNVERDCLEAMKWHQMAAEQNLAASQFSLGMMYLEDECVLRDLPKAYMWFGMAADNGFESAASMLDDIAPYLSDQEIMQAQRMIRLWKENHQ